MKTKEKTEIMKEIASFLRYGIQGNIIIECNKKQKVEVKIFLEKLKKDVAKYEGKIIILSKKINWRSGLKLLEKNKDKKIILILDDKIFPTKSKDVDNLFYYLSRLPLEITETNILLVENKRDFYLKLSDATISSLLPIGIELK